MIDKATVAQQPARSPVFPPPARLVCVFVTPETRTTPAPDQAAGSVVSAARSYQDGLVDAFLAENDALTMARATARRLGCVPVSPGSGATLRFLAAAVQARAVVEVGTGAGVSGLCLLAGMAADGVLTSIDIDPEYQRVARRTFAEAGVPAGRVRLIMGQALEVLPRLTDGGYDLVFCDATQAEYPRYHELGVRLLRPGGIIAFDNLLADPERRDADPAALRETALAVRADERLLPVLLPLGGGLLVAAKKRKK